MPARMNPEQTRQFELFIAEGYSINKAAKMSGVSSTWATNHIRDMKTGGAIDTAKHRAHRQRLTEGKALGRPRRPDELCAEARRALVDFDYFRRRYFGHISTPWQVAAGETIKELRETPHEEYVVMNEPPGTGKSTWLVDLYGWLIVQDRAMRTVMGSATQLNARRQLSRLRRYLEREIPVSAKPDEVRRGLACNAESTLAADFGVFRPVWQADVWRADEFVVVQADEQPIDEKEPTGSAVGYDTGFLGNRYHLIGWDDLETRKTLLTVEAIEKKQAWWDEEAESRLEPGGLMLLVGQRMAANDIYRYALNKLGAEEVDIPEGDEPKQYHHIVWKAHDEDKCAGDHSINAQPQPEGCLLDPVRASWRKLERLHKNNPRVYAVQFQQEDADPEASLVHRLWVEGGRDPVTGESFPGCWDEQRGAWQLSLPHVPARIVLCTVDTSPRKWWAVQAWCWYPHENRLDLLNTIKERLTSADFLDREVYTGRLLGVMPEWQEHSAKLGIPIQYWIIESGSAASGQALFQLSAMPAFRAHYRDVRFIEHNTTGTNRSDENVGIPSIKQWWRSGAIHLPGAARAMVKPLVDEVTTYPNAGLYDQVMANWFAVHNMPRMSLPRRDNQQLRRPAFLQGLPSYRPGARTA